MRTLTVKDAEGNFGELLLSAQHEPIKISKSGEGVAVVMSVHDYEELEAMKADYLQYCFEAAKRDLTQGNL
ncbi:prevent-host-death protein (plasmid) [Vibrio breoganii]|uniref:Antitoxin n=1 Tax=Vibrio breoganii TaxID=553239 RepID=A0AAN0XZ83_9VIBR|nr:type II toxin-antitoxin system Phd/YefM family antitoxin [Vibrio breoganii]ANO35385.1 prevent-host-death protein [Vibrio breoganii]PML12693.1 prevent-host-death protein [Vibrio breoganii]